MSKTKEKKKRTVGFKLGIAQAVIYLSFALIFFSFVAYYLIDTAVNAASFIGYIERNCHDGYTGLYLEDEDYATLYVNGKENSEFYEGKPYLEIVYIDWANDEREYERYDLVSENMDNESWVFAHRETGEEITVNFSQAEYTYESFLNYGSAMSMSVPFGVAGGIFALITVLQFVAVFKGSKSYHGNNLGIALNAIILYCLISIPGFVGAIKDRKIALATDEKYLARQRAKEQKRLEKQEREMAENDGSYFSGGAIANFFINWLAGFVSLITLGLAYPAMSCWKLRWKARHTYIKGKRLRFDGKALQFFGKFMLWLLLSVITLGLYYIFCMKVAVIKWQTKHTHFEDTVVNEEGEPASRFDGHAIQLFGVNWLARFVTFITLSFGSYWAHCYKERWFCKHKTIDGQPLKFDGRAIQYFGKRVLWWLLTVVTLGIYGFWLKNRSEKWTVSHTKIDEEKLAESAQTENEVICA